MKSDTFAAVLVAAPLWQAPATARADEPLTETQNMCPGPGGQGEPCATADDCELNTYATVCVEHTPGDPFSRRCEIPCEAEADGSLVMQRAACALGETCVEGKATPGRKDPTVTRGSKVHRGPRDLLALMDRTAQTASRAGTSTAMPYATSSVLMRT